MNKIDYGKIAMRITWLLVYIFLLSCFPIGYILLFILGKTDTKNYTDNSKKFLIIGIITLFIGAYFVAYTYMAYRSSSFEDMHTGAVGTGIFVSLGIAIFVTSQKYRKFGKKYDSYCKAIKKVEGGSIEKIAKSLNEDYVVVENTIQKMIDLRILENCYIDRTMRKVEFLNNNVSTNRVYYENNQNIYPITVKCENCGGTSVIEKGELAVCDYCGSALKK